MEGTDTSEVATVTKKNTIEQLKNNLPIISIALLILGSVNLLTFYSYFNIEILSYLDFTEILQIQFKLFAIFATITVVYIILTVLTISIMDKMRFPILERKGMKVRICFLTLNEIHLTYYAKDFAEGKVKVLTPNQSIIVLWVGSSTILLIMALGNPEGISFYALLLSILLLMTIMYYAYLGLKIAIPKEDHQTLEKNENTLIVSSIYFITLYLCAILGYSSAKDIVTHKAIYEATVVMENKTFSTNKNYKYIGRTKNFTFFYNIANKQSESFPNSDIKNMLIKEGKDYMHPTENSQQHGFPDFTREGLRDWLRRVD